MNKILYTAAIISLTAITAGASTPLDSLVMAAADANPSLAATSARFQARAAAARADNMIEAPELEGEYLWGREGDRWNAGIAQRIDWPGLYRARSQAADAAEALADIVFLENYLDYALNVKLSLLDVINARRRLAFLEETAANVSRINSSIEQSYALGEATALDLYKTRVAVVNSRREVATARGELESLLASPDLARCPMPDADSQLWLEFPIQPTGPMPVEALPQWASARAAADAAEASMRVTRRMSLPSLSLGYVHAYEDHSHFNGLSVSISLPSPARRRRIEATMLDNMAEEFEYDRALLTARCEVEGQYQAACTLGEALDAYRGLTDDNSYLELLGKAYDAGELTVIDYITEVNLFVDTRLGYLDLQYRYNCALARLNRYRSPGF